MAQVSTLSHADVARAKLRAGLNAQRLRNGAARILDEQASERAAIRAARSDAARAEDSLSLTAAAEGRRPDDAALLARRRDQYRRALDYPMTSDEVFAACLLALDDAGLPLDGRRGPNKDEVIEDRAETLGALLLYVQRTHGCEPIRADMGRDFLKRKARWIYNATADKRERVTGMRKAAAQLASWRQDDDENAPEPDTVMAIAENLPAREPVDEDRPIGADTLAKLGLSPTQASALAYLLESRKKHTLALTGAERVAIHAATRKLTRTYPDALSIRAALRPALAPTLAVEAAQRIERGRAALTSRGGGGMMRPSTPYVALLRVPIDIPPTARAYPARPAQYGPAAITLGKRHQSTPADVLAYIGRHLDRA